MIVPSDVVDAVRRHAVDVDAARPGFESLGVLVLDGDGRTVRYTRLANAARQPDRARLASEFQLRRRGGLPLVVCHSHPTGAAVPSEIDWRSALRHGWDVIAIYSLRADELRLWRAQGDGFTEVAFEVAS